MSSHSFTPWHWSVSISLLIFCAGATLAVRERRHANSMRDQLSMARSEGASGTSPRGERERPLREDSRQRLQTARRLADEWVELSIRAEEWHDRIEAPPAALEAKWWSKLLEASAFDAEQVAELLRVIAAAPLAEPRQVAAIGDEVLKLLADHDPAAAVELAERILRQEGFPRMSIWDSPDVLLGELMAAWAVQDANAAYEWLHGRRELESETVWSRWHQKMIEAHATVDPVGALEARERMGQIEMRESFESILGSASTPDARAAAVREMRNRLGAESDADQRWNSWVGFWSSSDLAAVLATDFETAVEWLEGHELSDEELAPALWGLDHRRVGGEHELWLDWIVSKDFDSSSWSHVAERFGVWMQTEPAAATRWLEQAPAGGLRDELTATYVEQALRASRPELALPQLPSLPQGERRDMLLYQMYGIYRRSDPARAAAFAREHGLED